MRIDEIIGEAVTRRGLLKSAAALAASMNLSADTVGSIATTSRVEPTSMDLLARIVRAVGPDFLNQFYKAYSSSGILSDTLTNDERDGLMRKLGPDWEDEIWDSEDPFGRAEEVLGRPLRRSKIDGILSRAGVEDYEEWFNDPALDSAWERIYSQPGMRWVRGTAQPKPSAPPKKIPAGAVARLASMARTGAEVIGRLAGGSKREL